jgi:hypothetical protein
MSNSTEENHRTDAIWFVILEGRLRSQGVPKKESRAWVKNWVERIREPLLPWTVEPLLDEVDAYANQYHMDQLPAYDRDK